ncbi:amidohydrolase family protein [Pelagicoccus albus]|uniref:Amidohydrolase family protein n=1 Tax=Pelagicoccus albus TaxID=415222 RepID=A0A7X1E786_9BACT|nr:amidohydrolase family protein [Pelagicoccus albus]MBC2604926.1 amidohydrolase family protein [Pelagicoccus albus]
MLTKSLLSLALILSLGPVTIISADSLLIKDVSLISMADEVAEAKFGYSVLIENGMIVQVGPSQEIVAPENSEILKGNGLFLLPGLIDMHVHVWGPADLKAYPAFGVTTVRNMSGMPFHLEAAKMIAAGEMVGPRLITTGPIVNSPGPNAQLNHKLIHTAEEARAEARAQKEKGYDLIKVYSNLNREAYEALVEEAELLGMKLTGHTPEGFRDEGIPYEKPFRIHFDEILEDHFQCIEHMESIVWHALRDDLDVEKLEALAAKIADEGAVITPTLVAHENLLRVAASQGEYLKRPNVDFLNPFINSFEQMVFRRWSKQPRDTRIEFSEFYLKATKVFQDHEIPLVAGSDAGIFTNIPGDALLQELELLDKAGLTPEQILKTTTTTAAEALGLSDSIGKILPGFDADLILVKGNPLANIEHLRDLSAVILHGELYDAAGIERLKSEAREASFEATQQRVLEALAAQGTPIPEM